jgi:hypothetical protein
MGWDGIAGLSLSDGSPGALVGFSVFCTLYFVGFVSQKYRDGPSSQKQREKREKGPRDNHGATSPDYICM